MPADEPGDDDVGWTTGPTPLRCPRVRTVAPRGAGMQSPTRSATTQLVTYTCTGCGAQFESWAHR